MKLSELGSNSSRERVDALIEALKAVFKIETGRGSDSALAAKMRKKRQDLQNWRQRGQIPPKFLQEALTENELKFVYKHALKLDEPVTEMIPETTGEDLALAKQTVDELLAGETGFTAGMKAELYGLALDELRELRSEGRESRFRRRLERLVSYSRRLALKGQSREHLERGGSAPADKTKP